jgi:hypothetical protein
MVGMRLPVDICAANSRYCTFLEEQRRTADRLLSALLERFQPYLASKLDPAALQL